MTQHYCSGTYYRKKINQEKRSKFQINKEHHTEEGMDFYPHTQKLCEQDGSKKIMTDYT